MRIDFKVFDEFGNEVKTMSNMKHGYIFPATRYAQDVYTLEEMDLIGSKMLEEAASQRNKLSADKYEQLVQRIDDDIATLKWSGYCNGIENYAWFLIVQISSVSLVHKTMKQCLLIPCSLIYLKIPLCLLMNPI